MFKNEKNAEMKLFQDLEFFELKVDVVKVQFL